MCALPTRCALTFVALGLGLLTVTAIDAQPSQKVWRVGFLGDGPRAERASISIEPLRDGLRELGYIENRHVVIDERWSEGKSELSHPPWGQASRDSDRAADGVSAQDQSQDGEGPRFDDSPRHSRAC